MTWSKQLDRARRAALCEEQGGYCFYCIEQMVPFSGRPRRADEITLDHLIPFCEGGRRGFPNEVAACNRCNNTRGTMPWLLFFCLKEIERCGAGLPRTQTPRSFICTPNSEISA